MLNCKTTVLALLSVASFGSLALSQEQLDETQKAKALEWLNQIKTNQLASSNARVQRAKSSLEAAAASDTAAFNLYLDAMKAQFMSSTNSNMFSNMLGRSGGGGRRMMMGPSSRGGGDSNKKSTPQAQFNEWKQQNTGSNLKPGFKKAAQLQCKWLLMTLLKAEQEQAGNEVDYSSRIIALLDEMAGSAKEISESLMMMPMVNSTIRNYLKINDFRSEQIPDNIIDIGSIFERSLLDTHRKNKDVSKFRNLWNKRISIEIAMASVPSSNASNNSNAKKEQEANKANLALSRQWERERACYQLGDEVQALANMQKLMTAMQSPDDKHKAIKDLEYLLTAKKQQEGDAERPSDRSNRPSGRRN